MGSGKITGGRCLINEGGGRKGRGEEKENEWEKTRLQDEWWRMHLYFA